MKISIWMTSKWCDISNKLRWMTEEIFSHPLHWGFVVLGWNALAIGGVLMQITIGMSKEFKKMQNSKFEDNSNSLFTENL